MSKYLFHCHNRTKAKLVLNGRVLHKNLKQEKYCWRMPKNTRNQITTKDLFFCVTSTLYIGNRMFFKKMGETLYLKMYFVHKLYVYVTYILYEMIDS